MRSRANLRETRPTIGRAMFLGRSMTAPSGLGVEDSGVDAGLSKLAQRDKSGKDMLRGGSLIATRAPREIAFAPHRVARTRGSSEAASVWSGAK